MTKQQRSLLIFSSLALCALMVILLGTQKSDEPSSYQYKVTAVASPETLLKSHSRRPGSVPKAQPRLDKSALSSPRWKKSLEKSLMVQAGGNLKKADIEMVDSFDWKIGKANIKVDSIVVKLEHKKGHRSSFRAIVDASSGKILQTWDHPVIDNFTGKDAGITLDPRYHSH